MQKQCVFSKKNARQPADHPFIQARQRRRATSATNLIHICVVSDQNRKHILVLRMHTKAAQRSINVQYQNVVSRRQSLPVASQRFYRQQFWDVCGWQADRQAGRQEIDQHVNEPKTNCHDQKVFVDILRIETPHDVVRVLGTRAHVAVW